MTTETGAPVRILRIASGGDGVGKLDDGRTVFVPRTAAGDLVTLKRIKVAKTFARAEVDVVVEPSPDRIEPGCPHYVRDQCGGCQLQHLALPAQLAAKQTMVGDALRRIGKLDVEDPEIEPAAAVWGYRNKVTLAVADDGRRIGFHRHGHAGEVFDLERCLIADAGLMELWSVVREHRALLPENVEQVDPAPRPRWGTPPHGPSARTDGVALGDVAPRHVGAAWGARGALVGAGRGGPARGSGRGGAVSRRRVRAGASRHG